jgi:hypothetical protein
MVEPVVIHFGLGMMVRRITAPLARLRKHLAQNKI